MASLENNFSIQLLKIIFKDKTRVNSDRSCKLNITNIGVILALSIASL